MGLSVRVLGVPHGFRDRASSRPQGHTLFTGISPTHRLNGQGLCLELGLEHCAFSLDACCLSSGLGLRLGGPGALYCGAEGGTEKSGRPLRKPSPTVLYP